MKGSFESPLTSTLYHDFAKNVYFISIIFEVVEMNIGSIVILIFHSWIIHNRICVVEQKINLKKLTYDMDMLT